MILSHRHRFIFFCNGKTGTTSIEHVLEPYNEGKAYAFRALGLFTDKHIPAAILRGCLPGAVWSSYFKFVFVRNPFDWFVSQWKHNFKPRKPARYGVPWISLSSKGELIYMGRPAGELARKEQFLPTDVDLLYEFLATYHRTVPYAEGGFQSSHVYGPDGDQLVDFVGRYESLREDMETALARIGLRAEVPHLNRTVHRAYPTYFTTESAARVAELWARDFELLGYAPSVTNPPARC
jgi:hypothetical protein